MCLLIFIRISAATLRGRQMKLCNFTEILTHSHTMTPFDALGNQPFDNTVEKGKIACNEQFLLFPQCFLPVWITFYHFCQI